jgi:hypothetical protein
LRQNYKKPNGEEVRLVLGAYNNRRTKKNIFVGYKI